MRTKCEFCREEIAMTASICPFCRSNFNRRGFDDVPEAIMNAIDGNIPWRGRPSTPSAPSLVDSDWLDPTYEKLRSLTSGDYQDRPIVHFASGPTAPSGNPRLYKYFWQVFSLESPLEGHAFMQHAPRLCTAQLEAEIERLGRSGLSCFVYSSRRHRKDPSNPWDLNHAKWNAVEFAPSWDDDIDPVVAGGHK